MSNEQSTSDSTADSTLAVHPEAGGTWHILFPGRVETVGAVTDRILALYDAISSASNSFLRPVEVECMIRTPATDVPAAVQFDKTRSVDWGEVRKVTHEDATGVTSQALSNSTTDLKPQDSVPYLRKITATRLQTKLALVGFGGWADRTDDECIEQTHNTSKPRVTPVDPNRLEIKHAGAPIHLRNQHETVFRLTIGCRADVWFTDDADQNRLRLKRFFEQLWATLEPVFVEFTSHGHSDAAMFEFLPETTDIEYRSY